MTIPTTTYIHINPFFYDDNVSLKEVVNKENEG